MDGVSDRRRGIRERIGDALSAGAGRADAQTPDTRIDRSPASVSAGVATGLSLLTVLLLPSTPAQLLGIPGVILLAGGAIGGSRGAIGYGFVALVAGILFAGLAGTDPFTLVLCAFCATVAWDVGRYGITVGDQLGRGSSTVRIELAHAVASATVGIAGAALGYAAFLVGPAGQPAPAVGLVLLGAVVLLSTMGK